MNDGKMGACDGQLSMFWLFDVCLMKDLEGRSLLKIGPGRFAFISFDMV